jgi:hypothetical protein
MVYIYLMAVPPSSIFRQVLVKTFQALARSGMVLGVAVEQALIVTPEGFPYGVACDNCQRVLTDGETYSHRLSAFAGDVPVVVIVCVPCGLGIA